MVPALSLWLPILLSAVYVFIASSLVHMVLKYHCSDYSKGASLGQWFLYCLLVGLFSAYLAGLALEPGAGFMKVFRFVGTVSFGGYFLALIQNSIWYKRAWSTTLKYLLDGFIYSLGTAAIFAWLWPG